MGSRARGVGNGSSSIRTNPQSPIPIPQSLIPIPHIRALDHSAAATPDVGIDRFWPLVVRVVDGLLDTGAVGARLLLLARPVPQVRSFHAHRSFA